MSDVRVKLNYRGMGELLKSSAIQAELRGRMQKVQAALPGSTLEVTRGKTRARAVVARGSDFEEANTGALSRALDLANGSRGTQVKGKKPRTQR